MAEAGGVGVIWFPWTSSSAEVMLTLREGGLCSISMQIYQTGTTGLLPWHRPKAEWWKLDVCFHSALVR